MPSERTPPRGRRPLHPPRKPANRPHNILHNVSYEFANEATKLLAGSACVLLPELDAVPLPVDALGVAAATAAGPLPPELKHGKHAIIDAPLLEAAAGGADEAAGTSAPTEAFVRSSNEMPVACSLMNPAAMSHMVVSSWSAESWQDVSGVISTSADLSASGGCVLYCLRLRPAVCVLIA